MLHVPYNNQPKNTRMCGASCAVMILRSYKKHVDRNKIWKSLKQPDTKGGEFIKTYRLVDYFLNRKLVSLAVRVKDPIKALDLCVEKNVNAILVCRANKESAEGHFMTLVDSDENNVVVHDPELGPRRVIEKTVLRDLFEPDSVKPETTPRMIILISDSHDHSASCANGHKKYSVPCENPRCGFEIPLGFYDALGCPIPSCSTSNVENIICPKCDTGLAF